MAGKIEERVKSVFRVADEAFDGNVVIQRFPDGEVIVSYGSAPSINISAGAEIATDRISKMGSSYDLNKALDNALVAGHPVRVRPQEEEIVN